MKVGIKPEYLPEVLGYMSGHSQQYKIDIDTVFEVEHHVTVKAWYHITDGTYSGWDLKKINFYEIKPYNFKDEIERILEC